MNPKSPVDKITYYNPEEPFHARALSLTQWSICSAYRTLPGTCTENPLGHFLRKTLAAGGNTVEKSAKGLTWQSSG